ncbi:TetR/AcrR family transcriptional regulator [Paenibacillus sp. DXFW5]|uniref:TetR/AcrR family transcriptional regulator n=1 Tax=Paenibacillus rhizolycopersici TaxID=2780073 RepID=A0ABS2H1I0_9BACL|nr:TetR/AcrR family transcriptional regulator [Paenibacillus rhizolycopersici]MBM6995262.1 TetR/AcrR family transcriptional regulator [Paenibacillus rhizolycopersici]
MPRTTSKMDPRILRSKSALRTALLQLMAQQPFHAITITDIVRQAGYNRGTFYANYGTKEELLNDMIEDKIQDLLLAFRAPYEKIDVFYPHELHAHSVMIFDHVARNADFYTVLTHSEVLPALREKILVSLKQIIMEDLRCESCETKVIDTELMVIYSLHALLGLIFHWIESGFVHSPLYMQEQLVRILHQQSGVKLEVKSKH